LALKETTMTKAGPSPVDDCPAPVRQEAIITPLIVEFLEWLAAEPRAYAEVMEFWRTSCPRLPIWEDAVDQGLVIRRAVSGQRATVEVTDQGHRLIAEGRAIRRAA
jgi:hypothetical protein